MSKKQNSIHTGTEKEGMILAWCRNLGLSGEAGRVSIEDSDRKMTRCGILKLQWNEEELHMDGC